MRAESVSVLIYRQHDERECMAAGKVFDRMSKGVREAPGKALIGELAAASGDRPEGAFGRTQSPHRGNFIQERRRQCISLLQRRVSEIKPSAMPLLSKLLAGSCQLVSTGV